MLSLEEKVKAPPMVYIEGEEMTHYASNLIVQTWLEPYFDLSAWERYDLSCTNRDATNDQVLQDAVEAGKRVGAIFKEPTITPTAEQMQSMGLTRSFGSPNGAMRRGWNGITISRDTIHIEGVELGYKNPVLFERHAVGGEYGAGWNQVGEGTLLTTFMPKDGSPPFIVDKRDLKDDHNVVVVYDVSSCSCCCCCCCCCCCLSVAWQTPVFRFQCPGTKLSLLVVRRWIVCFGSTGNSLDRDETGTCEIFFVPYNVPAVSFSRWLFVCVLPPCNHS